jgi:hypothetical protein
MAQRRKLQVFVSSTYEDLKEERQVAVQAILTAGHIPAGMELFTAGNQTQMDVIKRWIDESDAFLLILGGRYGSIDPATKKSYIQLEYEYAQEKGKRFFAVVIDKKYLEKKIKSKGSKVTENSYPRELNDFRATVLTKLVKMWSDPRDIKIAVSETLSEFDRSEDLVGWVRGNQAVDTAPLIEQMNRLARENESLRVQLSKSGTNEQRFSGLTFDEMFNALSSRKIQTKNFLEGPPDYLAKELAEILTQVAKVLGDSEPSLVHVLWLLRDGLGSKFKFYGPESFFTAFLKNLSAFNLLDKEYLSSGDEYFAFSPDGRAFVLRLELRMDNKKAEKYYFSLHPNPYGEGSQLNVSSFWSNSGLEAPPI